MIKTAITKANVQRSVLKNEPFEAFGCRFYGLRVTDYEEWQNCKSVWLLRQSTLPVSYIMMPFLDALFSIDKESIERSGTPAGTMYAIMQTIANSLRLPEGSVESRMISVVAHEGDLKGFFVTHQDADQGIFLPKEDFPDIRNIIAWQQGEEVPDESLNDDLLEEERIIAEMSAGKLEFNMNDLMASVALNMHIRIQNVLDMSIPEFETMRVAIDRDKKHMICATAESAGTTWKGGNPYPSWSFNRKKEGSAALTHISKFEGIAQK